MDAGVLWLVVAAVLVVAEVLTLTLVLGLLGAAAALAGVAALLGAPAVAQVLVFAGAGVALTVGVRPVARRHLQPGPSVRTGVAALEGRPALVTSAINGTSGRVRLGGESWLARPLDPTREIPAGRSVAVAKVDGATLVVYETES